MVEIQSATAEIRRGQKKTKIKKEERKKAQGKNIMPASATQGGHKEQRVVVYSYIDFSKAFDVVSHPKLFA